MARNAGSGTDKRILREILLRLLRFHTVSTLLGPWEGPLRGRLAEDDLRLGRVVSSRSALGRQTFPGGRSCPARSRPLAGVRWRSERPFHDDSPFLPVIAIAHRLEPELDVEGFGRD